MEWTIEELKNFRNSYPKKTIQIGQINWTFFDINESKFEKTILFLHGTTGSSEIFWLQLKTLKKQFRVISIDIPPIPDVFKISEDLHSLVSKLNVHSLILVGTSYGGYLAQAFASMYASMVSTIVLSNTFVTTDIYNQKYRLLLKYQRIIPTFILKYIMKKSLNTISHEPTRNYLLDQLGNSLDKKTLIARLKGFINNHKMEKMNIDSVLIIETQNDPLIPISLQKDLREVYSNANVHTFEVTANHFPYLTQSEEYTQILLEHFHSL
jgi:maspardin